MTASEPGDHQRTPLRRASYVHVSDLIRAYNIDHEMLEQELSRANSSIAEQRTNLAVTQVDPNSVAGDLDVSLATASQKRLQPPRGGFNLCVLVGNVNIVVDKRRVDGSRVRLAEVEIGDETGTVSLRARDEQIDVLEKVSARAGAVVLRNCTLELFQGRHIRLAVTKWAKISPFPDNVKSTPPPPSNMNEARPYSSIDLTIVAEEMAYTQKDTMQQHRFPAEANEAVGRAQSGKDGGHGNSKQSNHSRRNSRDRRHPRGKVGTFGNRNHYNLPENDRRMLQPNQLNYRGMHGYSRFPEGFGLSPYPYHIGAQHEVVSPVPTQQFLFQQQYDLQHGHFQQSYAPTQDQNAHAINQAATARYIIDPSSRGAFVSNSLNTPIVSSDGSGLVHIGASPEPNSSLRPSTPQTSGPVRIVQRRSVSPEDVQRTSMRMNPDAMAFAPASYSQPFPQPYFQTYHLPVSHSISLPTFGQMPQYAQTSDASLRTHPQEQATSPEVHATRLAVGKAQEDASVVAEGNVTGSNSSA